VSCVKFVRYHLFTPEALKQMIAILTAAHVVSGRIAAGSS
jgi:hypothetical protein